MSESKHLPLEPPLKNHFAFPVRPLVLLLLVSILAHLPVLWIAEAYINSDFTALYLFADRIGTEGTSPFHYYSQSYGGTLLSWIRWGFNQVAIPLFRLKSHYPEFESNQLFSYMLMPLLTTAVAYVSLYQVFSPTVSWITGLSAAIGFQYWVHRYGADFYWLATFLGFGLLAYRTRFKGQPFFEMSHRGLFGLGILSGFSLYTLSITLVYIAVYFVPTLDLKKHRPHTLFERIVISLTVFFFGLFFYLKIFDSDLGTFGGRWIRLHAFPNFKIGLFLLGFYFLLKNYIFFKSRENLLRIAIYGAGLIIGYLPDLFLSLQAGRPVTGLSKELVWFEEFLFALRLKLPLALKEFVTGIPHLIHHTGIERQFAYLWVFLGSLALLYQGVRSGNKMRPILWSGIFSIFIFCSFKTYDFAVPRYLTQYIPILIFSWAAAWEIALKKKILKICLAIIALGTALYQIQDRCYSYRFYQEAQLKERFIHVVELFRNQGVSVVISDDYWVSNNFTAISQGKPFFISTGSDFGQRGGHLLLKTQSRVGWIQTRAHSHPHELIRDKKCTLTPIPVKNLVVFNYSYYTAQCKTEEEKTN